MPPFEPLVLTPTPRLARNLARQAAATRVARGEQAWVSPRILSFPAWLSGVRDDYFVSTDDPRVPIGPQQALVLWQSLIDRDVFIGEPRVAELAMDAWRLIHEYALTPPERWQDLYLSEDSRRFKDWASRYRAACERQGLVDDWSFYAEIPGLLRDRRLAVTGTVELAGFDLPLTPLQQAVVDAMASSGAEVVRRPAAAAAAPPEALLAFAEPDHELTAAAQWARARLTAAPDQRIAVVIPDLAERLGRVETVFRQVFDPPGFALHESGPEPWHISLGLPLARWPLVADALTVLALAQDRISQPVAGRLLRSPFVAGWTAEADARDQALLQLARNAPYEVTAQELQWVLTRHGAQGLVDGLDAWHALRRHHAGHAWPSEWAARFQQELSGLGFGHGRALDSREYQVLQRWHELLESFSALDVVCAEPLPRPRALGLLTERARGTVFREHDPGAPVEVFGVAEALGSRFDAVWITTLDSDTWPGPVRRDPLIPAALQASVPRASSDGCLTQARLELQGLLAVAAEVQASFSRGNDEQPREPTALLADCPLRPADAPPSPAAAALEVLADDVQAPPLDGATAGGGVGVLRQQSDCPFRAFVDRRLGGQEVKPPRPGLDAAQRGTIIHLALEQFWSGLADRQALVALSATALAERIAVAVTAALDQFTRRYRLLLSATGRGLEQRRTERVLERWLDQERARGDFAVETHEREVKLTLGGLTLNGKIDRIDRLADGRTMLIDYKTGRTRKADWAPAPRMADPQLPAYAIAVEEPPAAIAFARIRPEELTFDGLADGDVATPGITDLAATSRAFKDLDDWTELMTAWRNHIEALAVDFRAGRAAVDPRKPSVCSHCHLHAVCRIEERAPYASFDEPDGNGVNGAGAGDE